MALSYAGVPLDPASREVEDWVARHVSLADLFPWYPEALLGAHRAGLTVNGQLAHRPVKLGRLRWPVGACEWATAFHICSTNQLALIRSQVYGQGSYSAQPLVLADNSRQIAPLMWMLPPRPLAQLPGGNGLWLLPLVDDRYWWWFTTAGVLSVSGGTTWQSLLNLLQSALGVTIASDAIPTQYLTPSPSLTSSYEAVPPILDTVAYNLGMRVVRGLDGTVSLQNPVTAAQAVSTELSRVRPVLAGGQLALPSPDSPGVLPQAVFCTFQKWQDGAPTSSYAALSCTPAQTGQSDLSGLPTNAQSKTFHETAVAAYTASTFTNQAELQALTNQVAQDWYRWQLSGLDLVYAGVADWTPNGMADVEWAYTRGAVQTRVSSGPYTDRAEELLHLGGAGIAGGTVIINSTFIFIGVLFDYTNVTFNFYANNTVNFWAAVSYNVYAPWTINVQPNTYVQVTGTCTTTLWDWEISVLYGTANVFAQSKDLLVTSNAPGQISLPAAGCSLVYRLRWNNGTPAGDVPITGLTPASDPELVAVGLPSPGPQLIFLTNAGTGPSGTTAARFVLKNGGGGANPFSLPNGKDLYLPDKGGIWLWWDTAAGAWKCSEPSGGFTGNGTCYLTSATVVDLTNCVYSPATAQDVFENGRKIGTVVNC